MITACHLGINSLITSESSEKNVIAYGPIFPDSPTKPNVVEKSLDYFMKVMLKLGKNKTVVTCDQAFYDIA